MKQFFGSIFGFLKRNAYYCLLAVSVLAIGTLVTIGIIRSNEAAQVINKDPQQSVDTPKDDEKPVVNDPIVFGLPVQNAEILTEFSMTDHVWNSTLKRLEIHGGMDFKAEKGAAVYAMYDGTVEDITTDLLHGTTVTIRHNDNLVSVYGSLSSETSVKKGDRVKTGDLLGSVSDTAMNELLLGPHLHVEVQLSGKNVDPSDYILFENK